ncbi:MAG: alpha/beta fold hydrolase [Thermodesulfobacteriota bacterium]
MYEQDFIHVNDFMIHYAHAGSGPPLILLHGGGTWHYTFRHNIAELSRYFSVYAPDMPGHGFTIPPARDLRYNLDTVAETLTGFMDALGIEKTHLLGHSWGGGWAIYFLQKHAARVEKLVLIASSGIDQRERLAWELLKWPVIGYILSRAVNRRLIRKGLENAFYQSNRVNPEMVRAVFEPLKLPHNQIAHYSYARHMDWSQTEQAMDHIRCPTLIIWGDADRYLPVDCGRQLANRITGAQLTVLAQSGHNVHEEWPGEVNRLVRRFLLSA